jgi:hypothetical protein
MSKEKQTIAIDGTEYAYEDLTQEQQILVAHIQDLDRKINSTRFNLDQLNVGKQAFFEHLKATLATEEQVVEEVTE